MDADALRRLRRTRGLTQAELARRVGVSVGYVAQIERGEVGSVSPLLERELARELGVSRDQLALPDPRARDVLAQDLGVAQARPRQPRGLPR